jgi:hypothetical protein
VRIDLIAFDDERPPIFAAERSSMFEHRPQVIDGTFVFANLLSPEPGEYRLKPFVAGKFLMERSLQMTLPLCSRWAPIRQRSDPQ